MDGLGNPLRFILTPGQASDPLQAEPLLAGFPAQNVLAEVGKGSFVCFKKLGQALISTGVKSPRRLKPNVSTNTCTIVGPERKNTVAWPQSI